MIHPIQSIMFTATLPDFRNLFYSSFSTNMKNLVLDQMLQDMILRTRLCGTGLITPPGWLFHFDPIKMVGRKCFVPVRSQLPKCKSAGLAHNYLYMIDRVGQPHTWCTHMNNTYGLHTHTVQDSVISLAQTWNSHITYVSHTWLTRTKHTYYSYLMHTYESHIWVTYYAHIWITLMTHIYDSQFDSHISREAPWGFIWLTYMTHILHFWLIQMTLTSQVWLTHMTHTYHSHISLTYIHTYVWVICMSLMTQAYGSHVSLTRTWLTYITHTYDLCVCREALWDSTTIFFQDGILNGQTMFIAVTMMGGDGLTPKQGKYMCV